MSEWPGEEMDAPDTHPLPWTYPGELEPHRRHMRVLEPALLCLKWTNWHLVATVPTEETRQEYDWAKKELAQAIQMLEACKEDEGELENR